MDSLARPQPLGAFGLPAGFLLIGNGEPLTPDPEIDRVRRLLALGRLPQRWPDALRGHQFAHAGLTDQALAAFAGTDPISRYNRFVLQPDGVDTERLRADLPIEVRVMVDVVRYAIGLLDQPPELTGEDGEIAAMVLSGQASAELSSGNPAVAVQLLERAAELAEAAPPLAGVLLGNAGMVLHEYGGSAERAEQDLTRALQLLSDTDLDLGRAEVHYQLAGLLHAQAAAGRRPINHAVDHYYSTLQLVDEQSAPQLWAGAQANLGSAYLTMPMTEASDQLRMGIAVQSLRAALNVFTRQDYPVEWASTQLNLANALVYTPSTHQGDNLVEAVELYEQVLELRSREQDPIGRARVLANQGNALAHLGIFDHAKAKLYEARYLFEEQLDHDSVMMVRSVLDEISRETVPQDGPTRTADPAGVNR